MFQKRSRPLILLPGKGFSLTELLVVIVIIGVIGSVGIAGFFFLVRRARVQSVALEIAGWIEQVRNAAADEVSPQGNQGGCQVNWFPNNGMAPQAALAIVDQNCTAPENTLFIPVTIQQETVSVALADGSPDPIIFTPRGLWTNQAGVPGVNFQLNIQLDGGGPLRCVRLSPTLGSVEIGRPNNFGGGQCQNWQLL